MRKADEDNETGRHSRKTFSEMQKSIEARERRRNATKRLSKSSQKKKKLEETKESKFFTNQRNEKIPKEGENSQRTHKKETNTKENKKEEMTGRAERSSGSGTLELHYVGGLRRGAWAAHAILRAFDLALARCRKEIRRTKVGTEGREVNYADDSRCKQTGTEGERERER